MACQGCGRVANARLCCPTCIEYGRTSFFCNQECFTTNWATHNQLHELLKKKKALAAEEGLEAGNAVSSSAARAESSSAASSSATGSSASGASTRPRASAAAAVTKDVAEKPEAPSGLRGPRGPAPLPGGTSLVGNLKRPPGAAHAPKKEAVVNTGGASILGGLVGRLASAVRGQAAGPAAAPPSSSAAERGERPGGTPPRGRAGPVPAAQAKASHGRNMRRFAAQATLWCLAVVAITAGGISYRESLRLEQPPSAVQLAEAAEAVVASEQGAAAAADADAAAGDVQGLRAEVGLLRERLERHDKMLRYIMDRYVEKAVPDSTGVPGDGSAGADGRAFATHEASSPGAGSPEELAHRGAAARPGDSPRKRKGGGADGMASVGLPVVEGDRVVMPESAAAAREAGPATAKADIGAVAPEGSRGVLGGSDT